MNFHVIDILICQKNPDEEVKVSLERVLSFFHINELKTQQLQILETLLQLETLFLYSLQAMESLCRFKSLLPLKDYCNLMMQENHRVLSPCPINEGPSNKT